MLGLFDCLGNRVAVYKSWRAARIGEAKRKKEALGFVGFITAG